MCLRRPRWWRVPGRTGRQRSGVAHSRVRLQGKQQLSALPTPDAAHLPWPTLRCATRSCMRAERGAGTTSCILCNEPGSHAMHAANYPRRRAERGAAGGAGHERGHAAALAHQHAGEGGRRGASGTLAEGSRLAPAPQGCIATHCWQPADHMLATALARQHAALTLHFDVTLFGASCSPASLQRYGPPPSYPSLKIPGLTAPIPPGSQFGYHPGVWGAGVGACLRAWVGPASPLATQTVAGKLRCDSLDTLVHPPNSVPPLPVCPLCRRLGQATCGRVWAPHLRRRVWAGGGARGRGRAGVLLLCFDFPLWAWLLVIGLGEGALWTGYCKRVAGASTRCRCCVPAVATACPPRRTLPLLAPHLPSPTNTVAGAGPGPHVPPTQKLRPPS